MKGVRIIFLIVSVLLAFCLAYGIVNTYVSIKYEIDLVRYLGDTVHIDAARGYLLQVVSTLRVFLVYVLITVSYLIFSIYKSKRDK